jgi:GNAT superfamily N-acetyltransferase
MAGHLRVGGRDRRGDCRPRCSRALACPVRSAGKRLGRGTRSRQARCARNPSARARAEAGDAAGRLTREIPSKRSRPCHRPGRCLLPDVASADPHLGRHAGRRRVASAGDELLEGADDALRDKTCAEVAVEIADHLHGRGLGTLLIERLAAVAERRGLRASSPRCCPKAGRCSTYSRRIGCPRHLARRNRHGGLLDRVLASRARSLRI